ncbi:MAG: endonuclease MutS2 [Oscillospiraceae bacterium]|nr:endonuclease MutS2 [Oscillospiraceae bacterium]
MNKYYKTIELHKILELLALECSNDAAKNLALSIEPMTQLSDVKKEISKTSDALELSVKYGTPMFYSFKNIAPLVEKASSGATLGLSELIEIRRMLHQISELVRWHNDGDNNESTLDYLFECLFPNDYLMRRLDSAIISEDELADDASAELASIRRKINRAGAKIKETLESMIKSSETKKFLQETRVTMRDGRYVLPVKTEHKGNINGLVHDTSSTGATLFIEPISVVEANNDIRILKVQEQEEIHRIIADFSKQCAEFKEQLISGYNASVQLSLYFAKANLAARMRACAPEISNDGIVLLKKARHPLIDKDKVVPIDVELGDKFSTLIITGPNTGGKTVILKTVGLLTAMTMCGLLIPVADGSKISIFEKILVDIGDNQSIEESLSTFSSHMNRVVEIIDSADWNSLVLVDELGSGTDPVEGAALAVSIIERLKQQGAKIICTTHYQELKLFAIDTEDVENASCEFDVNTLRPTYRLIIGSPGKSNAFEISRQLGIPDDIINDAKALLTGENRRFEEIIENLERTRLELETLRNQADEANRSAQKLKEELEVERSEFEKHKEKELEIARREANAIVKRVTAQSEKLIDELDEIRKQKEKSDFAKIAIDAKHKSKSTLNQLYNEANPITTSNEEYVLPRPLVKGDNVIIADMNKKGIVVTPPDDSGNCFIQAGIMKTKIHVSKLRLVEKQSTSNNAPKKQKGSGRVTSKGVESKMTRRPQLELDIRGYASDDGVYEVDNFLDQAVMSGSSVVTIIHGKGTGVLKNSIRNHLKRHPHVASFRKGLYGEGEDGVTIVELK